VNKHELNNCYVRMWNLCISFSAFLFDLLVRLDRLTKHRKLYFFILVFIESNGVFIEYIIQ